MVLCVLLISWSRVQARYTIPFYSVERPTVKTLLSYELESEERTGTFTNFSKDTETIKEKFEIRTKGWVYHPALLIFTAGLTPEFKQQSVDVVGGSNAQENDATFLGYFIDSTFLQYKPYTLNLYASKDRSDFASSLASDTATESSVFRGQLFLKYQPFPTNITIESKEKMTDSFFVTSEESERVRIESKHENDMSETELEAEFFDQIRTVQGAALSGERNFLFINNRFKFDEDSNLSSGLRLTDNTSGSIDSTTSFFSSQLSVRHHENLRTQYEVRIEDREDGAFTSSKRFGSAELTHQLYENLTTTLSGNIDQNEFTEGNLDSFEAAIDLRYIRRIPWGNLNINLSHREKTEDDQRNLAFAQVNDEAHVLTLTNPELLAHDAIDISTIVVTNDTGVTTYIRDTHYTLNPVGTSIFITRIDGVPGGINNGDTVLVDYSFEADPPAKIATITDTFGVNVNLWSMLRLYYQNSTSKEEFISGIEPSELIDNTTTRTGVELRWKWSTTRAEVEDRDTTRTPTKRFRFSETLAFRPSRRLSFSFVADFNKLELIDTNEESEGTGLTANLQWDLGGSGQLSADGFSQQITGSAQNSDRQGIKALYKWRYGAWRPSVRLVWVDEVDNLAGETRNRSSILFTVERQF